jgi:hypothetical protein
MGRHRFEAEPDPNFNYDDDPDKDPDWFQKDADHHADPPPNFTQVGKYGKNYSIHGNASLRCVSFRIRQNDADPTRSESTTLFQTNAGTS